MGVNRNLKRDHKWVLAQLAVQFNPSLLQSPDASGFKGTPNPLCICSWKPMWGRELTAELPSKQPHKYNSGAKIHPTNCEVWSSLSLFLEFVFLRRTVSGMNGLCQELLCFQPMLTRIERDTQSLICRVPESCWTSYNSVESHHWSLCSQDDR